MRTSHWAVLVGLCLAAELVGTSSGRAQSMLFPVGQPYTFASGFSGPTVASPTNIATSNNVSSNVVTVLPQQSTGMMTTLYRNLMLFPNLNMNTGTSPLPAPSSFPGAAFFNNLNPFVSVGH